MNWVLVAVLDYFATCFDFVLSFVIYKLSQDFSSQFQFPARFNLM